MKYPHIGVYFTGMVHEIVILCFTFPLTISLKANIKINSNSFHINKSIVYINNTTSLVIFLFCKIHKNPQICNPLNLFYIDYIQNNWQLNYLESWGCSLHIFWVKLKHTDWSTDAFSVTSGSFYSFKIFCFCSYFWVIRLAPAPLSVKIIDWLLKLSLFMFFVVFFTTEF